MKSIKNICDKEEELQLNGIKHICFSSSKEYE